MENVEAEENAKFDLIHIFERRFFFFKPFWPRLVSKLLKKGKEGHKVFLKIEFILDYVPKRQNFMLVSKPLKKL